jgi:hypothetical protein
MNWWVCSNTTIATSLRACTLSPTPSQVSPASSSSFSLPFFCLYLFAVSSLCIVWCIVVLCFVDRYFDRKVHFRGLLEFSNVCQKDCGYCGIRKHAKGVHRYTMSKDEIVETCVWAFENGYGSVMLQSGELVTDKRMDFVEDVIRTVRKVTIEHDIANRIKLNAALPKTPADASTAATTNTPVFVPPVPTAEYCKSKSCVPFPPFAFGCSHSTLCDMPCLQLPNAKSGCRTLTSDWVWRYHSANSTLSSTNAWYILPASLVSCFEHMGAYLLCCVQFDAGAHRYLLRIETSNPELYARLHPPDHSHAYRVQCLKWLKEIGFQVGTGIMIGLPDQTEHDLAKDLKFFQVWVFASLCFFFVAVACGFATSIRPARSAVCCLDHRCGYDWDGALHLCAGHSDRRALERAAPECGHESVQ